MRQRFFCKHNTTDELDVTTNKRRSAVNSAP